MVDKENKGLASGDEQHFAAQEEVRKASGAKGLAVGAISVVVTLIAAGALSLYSRGMGVIDRAVLKFTPDETREVHQEALDKTSHSKFLDVLLRLRKQNTSVEVETRERLDERVYNIFNNVVQEAFRTKESNLSEEGALCILTPDNMVDLFSGRDLWELENNFVVESKYGSVMLYFKLEGQKLYLSAITEESSTSLGSIRIPEEIQQEFPVLKELVESLQKERADMNAGFPSPTQFPDPSNVENEQSIKEKEVSRGNSR